MYFKLVFALEILCFRCSDGPRTGKSNKLMTAFVHHKTADLTLESLLSNSPDEVCAVAAERGLLEESGSELVVLHFNDPLVFECPLPLEDWESWWRRKRRGERGGGGRWGGQGQG